MGHNIMEATKKICDVKGEGPVDQMIQEISLGLQEP